MLTGSASCEDTLIIDTYLRRLTPLVFKGKKEADTYRTDFDTQKLSGFENPKKIRVITTK